MSNYSLEPLVKMLMPYDSQSFWDKKVVKHTLKNKTECLKSKVNEGTFKTKLISFISSFYCVQLNLS